MMRVVSVNRSFSHRTVHVFQKYQDKALSFLNVGTSLSYRKG